MSGPQRTDTSEKDAWIKRVLSYTVTRGDNSGESADPLVRFKAAIDDLGAALDTLSSLPEHPALAERYRVLQELYRAKDVERGLPESDKLREEVAPLLSRARAADAAIVSKGSVGRAKLQLELREAHAKARENLRELGRRLLALPEVQQDSQLAKLKPR
jgi:hypothetical protein